MIKLDFTVPFSSFASTTFLNCFTSAYLSVENLHQNGIVTDCSEWKNGQCDRCGNCATKPHSIQEKFFFLFDTMCGHSSLRLHYDGTPTEMSQRMNGPSKDESCFYDGGGTETIDFLFGFTGYSYQTITEKALMQSKITASLDADKPVIVRLIGQEVPFCLITGYDDNGNYLMPEYRSAQKSPDHAPTSEEIEAIYLFGDKTTPKYTLLDGMKRIEQIMEYNLSTGLWEEYMKKIGSYGDDSLGQDTPEGRKTRMNRLAQTMWHLFNCHNFKEVFRVYLSNVNNKIPYDTVSDVKKLASSEFVEPISTISWRYGYSHDLAWSIIGLDECIRWDDWKSHYYGDMLEILLMKLKENDEAVLAAIRTMISLLCK